MPASALVVIDVQESFRHRPYWNEAALPALRDRLLALIGGCRALGVPIVHILHEDGDEAFSPRSGLVRPMDWLPAGPDATFVKHVHNAFTDTGLDRWLRTRGIDHLIVSGIRTEQCCETTARVASDLGYRVDFVSEATLTFDMTHPGTGRVLTATDLVERTETVLAGRFATVSTIDEVLASLAPGN
ncbi:isochorismatase family protein [Paludibacterium paludis]|uniref:Hydrolase n=1 Tax=Paludibacterium paludis TaxID=1225769 RepID=A0A918NXD6_9NEIS|nr:isochorismatase family protein [Paludibacterium paludis]GGY03507.1 hydrolase [Paludibacterium paludis]